MKSINRFILLSFIFVFVLISPCQCKTIKKNVEFQTKDARVLKAEVSYVSIEGMKKYPTVILLHSLGYSSESWGNLIQDLNNAGYAVVAADFRGHGKSVYNTSFQKRSWTYYKQSAFQKFPSDIILILNELEKQNKKLDFNNYAIVGADIGANTAILVSKELKKKPKTLVLISPTTSFKGLYTPIALADMGHIPVLSMASNKDKHSVLQQQELAKFSQGGFYAKNYPEGGMGMLMLKVNPSMSQDITRWIIKYLK